MRKMTGGRKRRISYSCRKVIPTSDSNFQFGRKIDRPTKISPCQKEFFICCMLYVYRGTPPNSIYFYVFLCIYVYFYFFLYTFNSMFLVKTHLENQKKACESDGHHSPQTEKYAGEKTQWWYHTYSDHLRTKWYSNIMMKTSFWP